MDEVGFILMDTPVCLKLWEHETLYWECEFRNYVRSNDMYLNRLQFVCLYIYIYIE